MRGANNAENDGYCTEVKVMVSYASNLETSLNNALEIILVYFIPNLQFYFKLPFKLLSNW